MLEELGIDIVLDKTSLAPGETTSGTAKYVVTQADVDAGKVYNKAVATGTTPDDGDPNTPPVTPKDDDEVVITNEPTPGIDLDKSADKIAFVKAGEEVKYTFTVTNTGNVTLKDVKVSDPMLEELGTEVVLEKTTLQPGESTKGSATYAVTQADVDAGKVYNKAVATGTTPDDGNPDTPPVTPKDDDEVVIYTPDETTKEETTIAPETTVSEETTVLEETTREESSEEVIPDKPSGAVTLYKKEAGADKYLDHAIFDLIQTSKYLTFELRDRTKAQGFNQLPVDLLRNGQVVKDNITVKANVSELVDYEVEESGSYTLAFEEYDKVDISYQINSDGTGFIITVKDIEEESTNAETSVATTAEEITQDPVLAAQISELTAQIASMRANAPAFVESTELVPGQPEVITPESTNEDGSVNPAITTVEMVPNVVANNQAEIDTHNASIAELEAQLAQLQAQAAETSAAPVTTEVTQAQTEAESSQTTLKEQPKLSVEVGTKVDRYVTQRGNIAIKTLRKGHYYFVEVEAPKGYITDTKTKHSFEIKDMKAPTIVLESENKPVEKETTVDETTIDETTVDETTIDETTREDATKKPNNPGNPGGKGTSSGGGLPNTGESPSNLIYFGLSLILISLGSIAAPYIRKKS